MFGTSPYITPIPELFELPEGFELVELNCFRCGPASRLTKNQLTSAKCISWWAEHKDCRRKAEAARDEGTKHYEVDYGRREGQ